MCKFVDDTRFDIPAAATSIDLSQQELTGTIPTEFGLLTDLTGLDVSDNEFTGTIPTQLGLLSLLVAPASSLENGGFESGSTTTSYEYADPSGWDDSGNTIFIYTGNQAWGSTAAYEGSYFLGLQNEAAFVSQTFTEASGTCELTFAAAYRSGLEYQADGRRGGGQEGVLVACGRVATSPVLRPHSHSFNPPPPHTHRRNGFGSDGDTPVRVTVTDSSSTTLATYVSTATTVAWTEHSMTWSGTDATVTISIENDEATSDDRTLFLDGVELSCASGFSLFGNDLTSSIPTELGQLTKLTSGVSLYVGGGWLVGGGRLPRQNTIVVIVIAAIVIAVVVVAVVVAIVVSSLIPHLLTPGTRTRSAPTCPPRFRFSPAVLPTGR